MSLPTHPLEDRLPFFSVEKPCILTAIKLLTLRARHTHCQYNKTGSAWYSFHRFKYYCIIQCRRGWQGPLVMSTEHVCNRHALHENTKTLTLIPHIQGLSSCFTLAQGTIFNSILSKYGSPSGSKPSYR